MTIVEYNTQNSYNKLIHTLEPVRCNLQSHPYEKGTHIFVITHHDIQIYEFL